MAPLPDAPRRAPTALKMPASRALLAAGAVAAGLVAGWIARPGGAVVAVLAVIVAAANGYAKAYSP